MRKFTIKQWRDGFINDLARGFYKNKNQYQRKKMLETLKLEKKEDIQLLYLVCEDLNNLAEQLEKLDFTLKKYNFKQKNTQQKTKETTIRRIV